MWRKKTTTERTFSSKCSLEKQNQIELLKIEAMKSEICMKDFFDTNMMIKLSVGDIIKIRIKKKTSSVLQLSDTPVNVIDSSAMVWDCPIRRHSVTQYSNSSNYTDLPYSAKNVNKCKLSGTTRMIRVLSNILFCTKEFSKFL